MSRIAYAILFAVSFLSTHAQSIAPRHLEKIAFDLNQKQLIVYGGAAFSEGKVSFPSVISSWNGKAWNIFGSDGPGTRVGHSLIYHDDERALYVVSGIRNDAQGEHVMPDVWKWRENKWIRVASDAPMKTSDGVYDPDKKRLLLFGDVHDKMKVWDGGDMMKFELWEFRNDTWKKLSADGPQPEGPYEVAFDRARGSFIIPVWESGKSFVWEWRDEKWNKIEAEGDTPEARNRFALAYDPQTKATYMFGGRNDHIEFFNDFWKWNGLQWQRLDTADLPPGRAGATMESGFDGLVLYGGVTERGPGNEIWIWRNNTWKQVVQD